VIVAAPLSLMMRLYDSWNASYQPSLFGAGPMPEDGPQISELNPATIAPGSLNDITVTGSGFTPASAVEVDDDAQTTSFVDPFTLMFSFRAPGPGSVQVTVHNGSQVSEPVTLTVATLEAVEFSGRTVDDIKAMVTERPELRDQVLHFERQNKSRPRLLSWLQHTGGPEPEPAPTPEPEPEPEPAPAPEPEPGP
jgi:hypothetical protein